MKLVIMLCLVLAALAAGQDVPVVTCRFLCFERPPDGTAALVAIAPGNQPVDCPLNTASLSKPVKLAAGNGTIEFRKTAADPAPLAVAKVPGGMVAAVILFVPKGVEQGYGTVVIEDSAKGFPPDGCVVLNLYQSDVRFVIGEHKILLPAGKTAALARPTQLDGFNMAGVAFQFQQGKDWRTAAETLLRFPEGQRHLFVTHVDPKTKRPRMRSFRVDP
jgi:hypothetical protein